LNVSPLANAGGGQFSDEEKLIMAIEQGNPIFVYDTTTNKEIFEIPSRTYALKYLGIGSGTLLNCLKDGSLLYNRFLLLRGAELKVPRKILSKEEFIAL